MRQPLVFPPLLFVLIGLFGCFIYSTQWSKWVLRFDLVPQQAYLNDIAGGDFRLFWAQGELAGLGRPQDAYNATAIMNAAMVENLSGIIDVRPSFYPPHFILMMEPFGHLSYPKAWHLYNWSSVLLLAFVTVYAFTGSYYALPLLLGFGGLWCALSFGQNSIFLTTLYLALAAWGARHERIGGVLLAIASFKPHLGILAPLMLLWRTQYTTVVWAMLSLAVLVGITATRYDPEIWLRYYEVLRDPVDRLIGFNNVQSKHMISLYATLRSYGLEPIYALAAQGVLALVAVQMLWRICRRALDPMLPTAALVTATLLAVPHAYSYDLMLLFIPIMVLVKRAQSFGWKWADFEAVVPAYVLPFAVAPLNQYGLPVAPVVLLLLLYRLKQHSRKDHA